MSRAQPRPRPNPWLRLFGLAAVVGVSVGAGITYFTTSHSPVEVSTERALPSPIATAIDQLAAAVNPDPEAIAPAARLPRVPVIMYHDIVEGREQVWFDTPVAEFREQLEKIRESGTTPITIQQLYEHLHDGKPLPPRPILLTFDDAYLGHYENAYPLLKAFNYPAVFFVHTAYVGVKTSKAHMSWEQLQQLDKEGLVSIQSHTVTHPSDLRLLSDEALDHELTESKRVLEEKLGHPVPYFAYPVGNQDERVRKATIAAGYKMSFTMDLGYAGQSPGLLAVQRFIDTRLDLALAGTAGQPDLRVDMDAPIRKHEGTFDRVQLIWLSGGTLTTNHTQGRFPVGTFVERARAVGGINGGFFAMAALRSDNSDMVGPYRAQNEATYTPGDPQYDASLRGRPVVLLGPSGLRFVPFNPEAFATEEAARTYMNDFSDLFVAGVWLVNDGKALTTRQIDQFKLTNHAEFRRRAFLGIDQAGRPVIGATLSNVNASQLARALQSAGMREVVLLDSGFSTSLVYKGEVLVTGHTSRGIPSRIVPHAILLYP